MAQVAPAYLGPDADSWPGFFRARIADAGWSLWSVPPDSGVATINPGFRPSETRWHRVPTRPSPDRRARDPDPRDCWRAPRRRPARVRSTGTVAGTAERVAGWVRSGSGRRCS